MLDRHAPYHGSSASVFDFADLQSGRALASIPLVTSQTVCSNKLCRSTLPETASATWRSSADSQKSRVFMLLGERATKHVVCPTVHVYEVKCDHCHRSHRADRSVVYADDGRTIVSVL